MDSSDDEYITVNMRDMLRNFAISKINKEKKIARITNTNVLGPDHPDRRFRLPRVLMDIIMDFVRDDIELVIFQNGSYDFRMLRHETSCHSLILKPVELKRVYVKKTFDRFNDDDDEYDCDFGEACTIVMSKQLKRSLNLRLPKSQTLKSRLLKSLSNIHDPFDYESDDYELCDYDCDYNRNSGRNYVRERDYERSHGSSRGSNRNTVDVYANNENE